MSFRSSFVRVLALLGATSALALACGSAPAPSAATAAPPADRQASAEVAASPDRRPPALGYRVVRTHPHDRSAFTQGLHLVDGELYEGTGLNGQSSLRRVDLRSGEVRQQIALEPRYFGEGIAVVGERIVQLTWQSGVGFVYDRRTFERQRTFAYPGEGWGLTYDGQRLIMSDGTDALRFWHPETLEETGRVRVRAGELPVAGLNELEFVNGVVFANVWPSDRVARVDPASGQVTGWLDFSTLLTPTEKSRGVDVLNGIAHDPASGHLLITGKLWPWVFEVALEDN